MQLHDKKKTIKIKIITDTDILNSRRHFRANWMIEAIWSLLHISILCCDHLDHKAPVKLRSEELKFSREKRNPSGRRTNRRGVRPLIIRQHRQDEQHDAVGDKKWYRLMPKITRQKWLFERLKTALYKVNRWKRTTHNLWLATSRKWDCSPGICHKHSAASSICNNLWCDSLGNWTDIQPLKWVGGPLGGGRLGGGEGLVLSP